MNDDEFRRLVLKPLENKQQQKGTGIKTPTQLSESIASYIANPTGKGSAYVANRSAIKQGLNLTFIKLLQKYRKHFYAIPYTYQNGDILFLVKVPSEDYEYNKISYDVIFFIKYNKDLRIENRDIEVYSNCPSFVFTYCYVYNQKGLFFNKLKDKMPTEALTVAPEVRNPIQSLGFEKSTYIAARYLVDGKCLSPDYIGKFSKKMDPYIEANLFNQIADPETIVAVYQHAKYLSVKEHRKQLSANEKKRRDDRNKAYAERQKAIEPKGNFIFHKAPRAKITARKAKRNLLNNSNHKNKK